MSAVTFRNNVTSTFSSGFYSGGSVLQTAPYKYDVALNGVGYMIDTKFLDEYTDTSVRLLRPQQDSSGEVGESSVNPEAWWTRSRADWSHGAGQIRADRPDSDHARYRTSKGVNVWTEHQISLLNDVDAKVSSSNTNLRLCPAGARLYFIDGTAVKYTTDVTADTPSLTTVTSSGANSKNSITSDGYTVWFCDGADVYSTNTGTNAASNFTTDNMTIVAYVKARLMAADATGAVYYCTNFASPTFTSLFTHNSGAQFTWIGFAEGQSAIYAAGYVGDKSYIYRIAVKPDGTGLDQPVVAGTLPDGEIIRSIGGYLGFIFVGTDKGWRFCVPDGQGNLRIGANVATGAAVQCWEGQDRFMWYGLTNYDSSSTGLGRADISAWGDQDRQQLAYATDLMATTQGAVLDVCTFQSIRVFAISGIGIYGEDTAHLVSSGTLKTGYLDFGISDEKVALEMSETYATAFAGSCAMAIAQDEDTTYSTVGTDTAAGTSASTFQVGEKRGTKFELQFTLSRDGTTPTTGPTLTSWTLRAQAAPSLVTMRTVPLLLFEHVNDAGNTAFTQKPLDLFVALKALHASREIVTFQEGNASYSVVIEDWEFRRSGRCKDRSQGWGGTFLAQLKDFN